MKHGKGRFFDFDKYVQFIESLTQQELSEVRDKIEKEYRGKFENIYAFWNSSYFINSVSEESNKAHTRDILNKLFNKEVLSIYPEFIVSAWQENVMAIVHYGNVDNSFMILYPERFIDFTPDKELSNISLSEIRASYQIPVGATTELIKTDASGLENESRSSLEQKVAVQKKQLEETVKVEEEKVSQALQAKKKEIERLQAELNEQKRKMEAELQALKDNAELELESLNTKIFMLDSQIYSIRSYMGETVSFTQLRHGKNAAIDTPVYLHQKLRYLDEDLGRITSLYEIQWNQIKKFETFLQHHPSALEYFAPQERCISLIRN